MQGKKCEWAYEDLVDLPHHTSPTRERMSRADRAAQFGAFMALTGYEDEVAEAARLTDPRADMTDDAKLLIDEKLRILAEHLDRCVEIGVTYFVPDERKAGGVYQNKIGTVSRIDPYTRCLIFTDKTVIPIDDIRDLDSVLFEHFGLDVSGTVEMRARYNP